MQQNCVNEIVSNWTELKQGSPHGTILGSFFFNLYKNDLPEQVSETGKLCNMQRSVYCFVVNSDIASNYLQKNIKFWKYSFV